MLTILIVSQSCKPALEPSLVKACSTGDVNLVKKLINEGANVNYRDNSNKFIKERTPLHIAVNKGHGEVVKLLLDNGADFTARTLPGRMQPLHYAAYEGFKDIAQLLIEKGADVNSKDRYSWTPLHTAVSRKHIGLVRLLIETGADVALKNGDGKTPLQVADNNEIIELLNNYQLLHPIDTDENTLKIRQIKTTNYSLEIPVEWEDATSDEKEKLLQMLSVDPSYKISGMSTVGPSNNLCTVAVYELQLPSGEAVGYVDKLQQQTSEKMRHGKQRGIVKDVVEIKKSKWDEVEALLIDWEAIQGSVSRTRQWIMQFRQRPKDILQITAYCTDAGYNISKEDVDRIAKSVSIRSER